MRIPFLALYWVVLNLMFEPLVVAKPLKDLWNLGAADPFGLVRLHPTDFPRPHVLEERLDEIVASLKQRRESEEAAQQTVTDREIELVRGIAKGFGAERDFKLLSLFLRALGNQKITLSITKLPPNLEFDGRGLALFIYSIFDEFQDWLPEQRHQNTTGIYTGPELRQMFVTFLKERYRSAFTVSINGVDSEYNLDKLWEGIDASTGGGTLSRVLHDWKLSKPALKVGAGICAALIVAGIASHYLWPSASERFDRSPIPSRFADQVNEPKRDPVRDGKNAFEDLGKTAPNFEDE